MGVSKKDISPCPIDVTLSVIDGRWNGTILWRLLDGPMRTSELRKSIPEITERMLLRHLRDPTGAGILERPQEQGLPLRVRYSLYRRLRSRPRRVLAVFPSLMVPPRSVRNFGRSTTGSWC
jgi:DNA-binding HxlR family transcriptional regulator